MEVALQTCKKHQAYAVKPKPILGAYVDGSHLIFKHTLTDIPQV